LVFVVQSDEQTEAVVLVCSSKLGSGHGNMEGPLLRSDLTSRSGRVAGRCTGPMWQTKARRTRWHPDGER
jgi:hypothetical protein